MTAQDTGSPASPHSVSPPPTREERRRESAASPVAGAGDSASTEASERGAPLSPYPPSRTRGGGNSRRSAHATSKPALLAGAAIAASFLIARFVELPGPIEPVWKAAGIVLLGLAVALSGAYLAAAAFFASAAGDFFLELTPSMTIAGMASFAVAHVFFVGAFALRMKNSGVRTKNWPWAAGVVAASVVTLAWLWSDLGAMRAPVIGYHVVLTAMVAAAILAPVSIWAPVGAVLFLLSDAVLGLGWFKGMEGLLGFNWPIYAAAQILLAIGLMRR